MGTSPVRQPYLSRRPDTRATKSLSHLLLGPAVQPSPPSSGRRSGSTAGRPTTPPNLGMKPLDRPRTACTTRRASRHHTHLHRRRGLNQQRLHAVIQQVDLTDDLARDHFDLVAVGHGTQVRPGAGKRAERTKVTTPANASVSDSPRSDHLASLKPAPSTVLATAHR